jgi:uncharacterized protein involved in exopolysaccharide biosynthesis
MVEPGQLGVFEGTDEADPAKAQLSLFDLVSVLVRYWYLIAIAVVLGGAIAVIPVLFKQYSYSANASFAPQNSDAGKANISALAGAFGISVPTGNLSQSPQFYADLVTSRVVLVPILSDTFTVPELGATKRTVSQLFELTGLPPDRMTELGVATLQGAVRAEVSKTTGMVRLTATSPWRSFSLNLLQEVLTQLNNFNLKSRQSQANDERRFVEGRLAVERESLRAAEGRLEDFLKSNRQGGNSPELTLARGRLQRDVDLNQQVATSLAQSAEDARIREVRDTPVITVIEPPAASVMPAGRGRARRGLTGMAIGGLAAIALAFLWDIAKQRLAAGDPELEKYQRLFVEFRRGLFRTSAKSRGQA